MFLRLNNMQYCSQVRNIFDRSYANHDVILADLSSGIYMCFRIVGFIFDSVTRNSVVNWVNDFMFPFSQAKPIHLEILEWK